MRLGLTGSTNRLVPTRLPRMKFNNNKPTVTNITEKYTPTRLENSATFSISNTDRI